MKMLEDAEERHKDKINQLELELENKEAFSQVEINEIQSKSEEALAQLKNFYELEKERLERRLQEEKDRA
jgi:hypothetical protein